jgi:hypothetical protein
MYCLLKRGLESAIANNVEKNSASSSQVYSRNRCGNSIVFYRWGSELHLLSCKWTFPIFLGTGKSLTFFTVYCTSRPSTSSNLCKNSDFLGCLNRVLYTVKKGYRHSRPQPGCHLPNSPWAGITKLLPPRKSLVGDIPAGDGNVANLFLRCPSCSI